MARILQLCNSDFYLTHFLAPLVRGLVASGHQVECVCDGTEIAPGLLGPGVRVHQHVFPRTNSPAEFLRSIQSLRGLLRRETYDCVNSHNRAASIVGRIAAWLERVPVNLYTAHGYYFHDDQKWLVREATIGLEGLLARMTDHTLSQSQEDVQLMTDRRLVRRDQIDVIGNGIDTLRFSPRAPQDRRALEGELGLRSGRFRVVSTGRLVRAKGFTDLLEAFATLHDKHSESELVIVGGNVRLDIERYQTEFFARARELGVMDAVNVTGMVRRVEDYLAASDVFVLASYREGLPRAMLEAMSTELPVIVTDIRGCRQLVEHGKNGLLFPAHDAGRLAELLGDLHDSAELREKLGKAGRCRVRAGFDESDYVARQVAAINRLVGAPVAPSSTAPFPSGVESCP